MSKKYDLILLEDEILIILLENTIDNIKNITELKNKKLNIVFSKKKLIISYAEYEELLKTKIKKILITDNKKYLLNPISAEALIVEFQ